MAWYYLSIGDGISWDEQFRVDVVQVPLEVFAPQPTSQDFPATNISKISFVVS